MLNFSLKEPIQYFKSFFSDELLDLFVNQSNLYATQKNINKPLLTNKAEIEKWFGLCIYFSVSKLPSCKMHFMCRDRFMQIKSNLHLVDNEANNSTDDKLSKVRPLIDHLHSKFQDIPMDQELCIEEQMVPFKGASGIKQYKPTKPNK